MTTDVAIVGAALLATLLLLAFIWWKRGADVGRTRFFKNQTYHFQTLRVFNDIPVAPIPARFVRQSVPFALATRKAGILGGKLQPNVR